MTPRNPIRALLLLLLPAAALAQSPALPALNGAFRASYAQAKQRVLAAAGPVLLANGNHYSLLHDGRREEAHLTFPVYDPVKTMAHLPLAVYVTLTPGDGPVGEDRLKTLAELRTLIPPAEASLETTGLSAATVARQRRIASASLTFLNDVIANRRVARPLLVAYTRDMAPLVLQNTMEAARAELDAVHAQVTAWRQLLSPAEWNRMHVVIIGPHMPREKLSVMQYFLRLLDEPAEGGRVIYAEALWEESKALDLLATHLLDGGAGEAFFGDPMRLHRDLLSDAAAEYIPSLLPAAQPSER